MSSNFNFEYDIFPLGDFETLPVTPTHRELPNISNLNISVDSEKIRSDFHNFNKENDYFKSRRKYFKNSLKDTVKTLTEYGFGYETYKPYPIRKLGTADLCDELGEYTKTFLNSFPVKLFRQQFIYAEKNLIIKPHIDHPTFDVHGFRLMIPVDEMYVGFDDKEYVLYPNNCYFFNATKRHYAYTKDTPRIALMCQMVNDSCIQI